MEINLKSNKETVVFAASELRKYLKMMLPDRNTRIGSFTGGIRIGCFDELNIDCNINGDIEKDDIIYIETTGGNGVISGNNPRSVLLAVYEYLRRQGCRWLFPGVDGEYIPVIEKVKDIKCSHKMSSRLRGQCIEGAVSQQNVLEAIDFAPKIGLNSFMLECYSPLGYYNMWYEHCKNDLKRDERISEATAIQWKRQCESEIEKRGLLYHDMGHGWTTLAFDINPATNEICVENLDFLAQIDGKRELFQNKAIETNFCMTNKNGRRKFIEYVADYAQRHNNVDFLHIWLGDGKNNHCTCDECIKYTPSEIYVQILNDLDKELTNRGIDTKLVFICYSDLFWAPKKELIKNSDRFLLLFAPYDRDYLSNYSVEADMSGLTEYKRNDLKPPKTLAESLAYLKKWREKFAGDVFCYEYHFHMASHYDIGGMWIAECAFNDARALNKNGICGMIEDQSQRNAYPTGFPIYAWAKALCDERESFDEIAKDYFTHAFGSQWEKAYDFLSTVSSIFSPEYMLCGFAKGGELESEEIHIGMDKIRDEAEKFKIICEQNIKSDVRCQSVSWQLLSFHCDVCIRLANVFSEFSAGNDKNACAELEKLNSFLSENEDFFQNYFDMFIFEVNFDVAFNRI